MPWIDFKNFVSKKLSEYTEEVEDARTVQDRQKAWNENYMSDERKERLRLEGLFSSSQNNEGGSGGSVSTGELTGTIQEKFWQYFTAQGYSKACVAGMMGNVQHESGFISDKIEQTPGATFGEGYGLIQWSYGRKERLINTAKERGKKVEDVSFQFEFLQMELEEGTNWLSTWANYSFETFKTTTDIKYATEAFCWMFERPNVSLANISGRIEHANKYYQEFSNKSFSKTTGGNATVQAIIQEAAKYLGKPYSQQVRYGPSYDCSSYLQTVFKNVIGRDIGNVTWAQEKQAGRIIAYGEHRAGDILLFGTSGNPYHVALSLGGEKIYHAADENKGIIEGVVVKNVFWPYAAIRVPELE